MSSRTARKGAFFLVALLLMLGAGVFAIRGLAERRLATEPTPVSPPLMVRVTPAEQRQSYTIMQDFIGRVESRRTSEIGFEIAGSVAHVLLDEGETTRQGAVLARLDTSRLEARRDELAAALREAEAQRDLAELTHQRQKRVFRRDSISEQEYDEARLRLAAAAAAVDRLQATLSQVRVDLQKSEARAPFDGVVARRFVDEGRVLPAGEPVLALLETRRPRARVGVSVSAAAVLAQGQRRQVRVNGREVSGVVEAVLPQLDDRSRTVEVLLALDEDMETPSPGDVAAARGAHGAGRRLRAGELVRLPLSRTVTTPGFWLPLAAMTENSRGLWSCFVAAPDGAGGRVIELRELELLHTRSTASSAGGVAVAYVRGGLLPGELVVAEGAHRLVQGMPVRVGSAVEGDALGGAPEKNPGGRG